MEIHQNPLFFSRKYFFSPLFFHENIFFLIRKSQNTPNSIFRANIRNLLLRAPTHGTYISTPPIHGILTPYPWYIDPPILGISNPSCNNVAPVTNLCLGRATTWSHSSQWSKKKVAVET
jgi:hypothetical protein